MKELCTFFIGQAGVQAASAVWEMLCLEHGVCRDGTIQYEPTLQEHRELNTVFEQLTPHEKYVPRAILADLEPSVIDEVRDGAYKGLFNPETLLAGMEDAAGNFARGYYTLGGKVVGALINSMRRMIEKCDNFEGTMTFSALGGGTGSGLLSMFQERACLEFAGRRMLQFSIVPSDQMAIGPVEVYNCMHHLYHSSDFCDLNIFLDNSALFNICTKELAVVRPTYTTVNRVIGPLVAGLTASVRFKCNINGTISEFLTNLIPFPAIHYPMITFVPFCTDMEAERSRYTTPILTRMVFKPDYRTVTAMLDEGVTLATCLTYRGHHSVFEILQTLEGMREERANIVDWCPTAFKVAYTPQPPVLIPGMGPEKITRSLVMITNSTAISEVFSRAEIAFLNLFSKRAFLHWYVGEGMEMEEFTDALEKVRNTAADIIALETESLNAMQAARKDDDDEEGEEGEEGQDEEEECEGHEGGDVGYTPTARRAAARTNTTASIVTPRRLNMRGTRNTATTAPPLYQLMNYPECPVEQETTLQSRPRMRKNKNKISLGEQIGAGSLAPQDCPCHSEGQQCTNC
ncbi:Tubulin alpha-3 chain [Echinococcus granulosus]|uniref:Tubulin alpha-3 chain n=1 Tax=Echinococcus granulosus TaxID=6210 RepID=W6UFW9_ECHGR|nr:Tubulin alpha-3 chain [Echinococcus granulosus]EUB59866.1 Tubulin alpha-3 chain [Echinococcus granulosus]